MNRHLLAWEPTEIIQPMTPKDGWTFKEWESRGQFNLVDLLAERKTVIAFAYQLKHGRPAGRKPLRVVGVGSDASRAFTEGTGLYDKVLTYDSDRNDLGAELHLNQNSNCRQ
jgi:hypothetical protein